MASDKKRKWWEGGILLLILLLTAGLMWIGLSGRKRTSHIYAYDESVNIRKEQKLADNGSGGEQTDSRQKETPPPDQERQQEPQTPPDPDIPDDTSSEKKPEQKKQDKKTDGADDADDVNDKDPEDPEEPDQGGEPDGDQSNTSGENDNGAGDNGDNGTGGNNGSGDGSGNGPGGNGPGVPAPAGTPGPVKTALPVVPSTGTPLPVRPVPSIPPEPKPTPEPTAAPTETPTQAPTATPEPDKPVSLACTWKDKDSLIYGKTIPKDTISVKVTMSSGKEITLSPSEYTIAGLKNDSLGEHIMTVVYENVSCKIRYTVNNAIDHLELDWPTKDKCYKGEPLEDADITVTVYMVDDTSYDLEDGQYTIHGIDNQKTDVKQSFTINYKDQKIEGTCTFRDRIKTYTDSYYDDSRLDETNTWSESVVLNEAISGRTGQIVEHNGKRYELMSISVTADGKKKSFSDNEYVIGRVFDIQITRRYELVK